MVNPSHVACLTSIIILKSKLTKYLNRLFCYTYKKEYDIFTHLLNCIRTINKFPMHRDDLKKMWICYECKSDFIFYSDVHFHKSDTGHSMLKKYNLFPSQL